MNEKALKALAAITVSIYTSYDDWREAILYAIALGMTLKTLDGESQVLYATALEILAKDSETDTTDAANALKAAADIMVSSLD